MNRNQIRALQVATLVIAALCAAIFGGQAYMGLGAVGICVLIYLLHHKQVLGKMRAGDWVLHTFLYAAGGMIGFPVCDWLYSNAGWEWSMAFSAFNLQLSLLFCGIYLACAHICLFLFVYIDFITGRK